MKNELDYDCVIHDVYEFMMQVTAVKCFAVGCCEILCFFLIHMSCTNVMYKQAAYPWGDPTFLVPSRGLFRVHALVHAFHKLFLEEMVSKVFCFQHTRGFKMYWSGLEKIKSINLKKYNLENTKCRFAFVASLGLHLSV